MSGTSQSELTAAEIRQTVRLLSKLQPGFLPLDIFLGIARLVVTPTVEVFSFRCRDNRLEILLTQRDSNDLYWPGMYHSPGSVIRATDEIGEFGQLSAYGRIFGDELQASQGEMLPRFWRVSLRQVERGVELAQEYILFVPEDFDHGSFYPVFNLPEPMIEHHRTMIGEAMQSSVFNQLLQAAL